MKFIVVSPYPTKTNPVPGIFVYKLVQEFQKSGSEITVISPIKRNWIKKTNVENLRDLAQVIRPQTFSFSNKKIGPFDSFRLTRFFKARTLRKAINQLDFTPDFIYCHFIVSAIHYLEAFPNSKHPVFIAVGEYDWIDLLKSHFKDQYFRSLLQKVTGFIAVSPQVKEKLVSLGVDGNKITIEPNATDREQFKPRNKEEIREKLNLPLNKKIILFVGRFINNKGVQEVQKSLDFLEDDVRAVFLGNGELEPKHPKIIFKGQVENKKVADYMATSDVFVLPSVREGSSNVIVEAMSSGLPIVSSNIPEIKEQCTPEFSILVNPKSMDEIAKALNAILSNDARREKMSLAARRFSKNFDLRSRAERILDFIEKRKTLIN